jgi:hypothetical protein|nr:MAG TPA: hypothetical protein [Caudoviricetes sp.]
MPIGLSGNARTTSHFLLKINYYREGKLLC